MADAEQRRALIIASDTYEDARLRQLRAPAHDAEELARVLADPSIGGFAVEVLRNEREYVLRRAVGGFFANADREDVLLLHLACHGIKDEDGTLYFAAADTVTDNLSATAVSAEFVNMQMSRSRSRRVVLFLDCCYSGAFARGMSHRGVAGTLDVNERFQGSGRVVLTASSSMEYAWEGDDVVGTGAGSVFTRAVVDGLQDGEADLDGDGQVSIDELYDYVFERVHQETPNQTPGKWSFDVAGDLYVARGVRGVQPAPLPDYLRDLVTNPLSSARLSAVSVLRELFLGDHPAQALAAQEALTALSRDDSRAVSDAATDALASVLRKAEPEVEVEKEPEIEAGEPEVEKEPEVETEEPVIETEDEQERKARLRRLALLIGSVGVVVLAVIVFAVLARGGDTPAEGGEGPTSGASGAAQPLTTLSPTESGHWPKIFGCTFNVEDAVLTVSQTPGELDFCKTGTVNDEFQSVLDPPTDDKLGDVLVTSRIRVDEGEAKYGLRCRGIGSTAAWSGFMASIDSHGRWMVERFDGGDGVPVGGPMALPADVSAGSEHRLDLTCVGSGDAFELEFAIDGVSVVSSTDLFSADETGQVGVAVDNEGSSKTAVEFREFAIFPAEHLPS